MKKHALLILIVLGVSTAAWAGPWACVDVPACVCSDQCVAVKVGACIPGQFNECQTRVESCVQGGFIFVDIYLTRYDKCQGSLNLCESVQVGTLCPGVYSVVARVYVKDVGPCTLPFLRPVLTAIGSANLRVVCCDPCCWPWPFW